MRTIFRCTLPHGVAFVVMFVVLVIPHVLQSGVGHSTPLKLTIALAAIGGMVMFLSRQFARYRALDELEQRVQLESLATAFVGTFCVVGAYWLLHAAGLVPRLTGR